jgi:hypothetical protein
MRVKHLSESRISWSLGRGEGDTVLGVEVFFEKGGRVRRTVYSRGKYGKEKAVFEEAYGADEFCEILRAEESLLPSATVEGGNARVLISEAMDRLRRVYDGL